MTVRTTKPTPLDATEVTLVDHGGGNYGVMVGDRPVPNLALVRADYEGGDLQVVIGGAFAIPCTADELARWGPALVCWAEGIGANGALTSTFARPPAARRPASGARANAKTGARRGPPSPTKG
jgi:hypothetical protein